MMQNEFQAFIDEQDELLNSIKPVDFTQRDRVFARTIKLGEEYGELCDEVLGSTGDQRKDKLEGKSREDLEGEFADVVIVAYLLAKSMDVDMQKALEDKVAKIRAKHNKILKGE